MFADRKFHIKVSGRSSRHRFSHSRQAYGLSVSYPRRNFDRYLLAFFGNAVSGTSGTLFGGNRSFAGAFGAFSQRRNPPEDWPSGFVYFSRPLTGGTLFHFRVRFGSASFANGT